LEEEEEEEEEIYKCTLFVWLHVVYRHSYTLDFPVV
jgi:hypothetical protein